MSEIFYHKKLERNFRVSNDLRYISDNTTEEHFINKTFEMFPKISREVRMATSLIHII